MDINRYDYALPRSRIAQFPAVERAASRLLVVGQSGNTLQEIRFNQIAQLLEPGDILVANNTRVLPARLLARKPTGGRVEIMLERILDLRTALVQLRASKSVSEGQILLVDGHRLSVQERREGFFVIRGGEDGDMAALFQHHGAIPLPPYIDRGLVGEDTERYQTVYARVQGAVAAPTAGLHFDQKLIDSITDKDIGWSTITLHVGAGTFKPVRAGPVARHRMHREWMEVDQRTCDRINRAKSEGGRVISVGTTVVRALESAAHDGVLRPFSGDTELFILPGHRFQVVDALITNFHLPKSTLLVMVCAFAGHTTTMKAYRHAIEREFRFYSYGDAMFIERQ